MSTITKTEHCIFVACLAAYNSGTLHGEWIDANQDADAIETDVSAMLSASPEPHAEEWAIHDYDLGGIDISESESFVIVAHLAAALTEHGEAFAAYYNNGTLDGVAPDEWTDSFEDAYCGEWDSLADYAAELTEGCHDIPDYLEHYINWDAMGRDMELGGDVWTHRDGAHGPLHIFNNF